MNLKRAVRISIVMYVISFLLGLIPMFVMGIDPSQVAELPAKYFIIGIVTSIILSGLFSLLYFKGERVKRSAKEGFYFGLALITVGFILDVIIFSITYITTDAQMDIFSYYANPFFWIALILVICTATIAGAIMRKKTI